ncbi:MAG: amidohydrolase [Clostridia bacterium]|nr:amidohydrolase [Clostridia bacterium]
MFPVIDTHCHIYPDKIAQKAATGIGAFYDVPMKFDGRLDTLKAVSARARVEHSLIFSVATAPRQVASINKFIASNVEKSGGRFTGLGTLHPDSEDMEGDVRQILALGLKGVKLHPDVQGFPIDNDRGMLICELCEQYHLPVLLHCGDFRYDYSNVNRLKPILERFRDLQVIGAHFGGWSLWEDASKALHSYDNFVVDSSSTFAWVDRDTAKRMIGLYGSERVLFGSDFPMWDPRDEIGFLLSLQLGDDAYENIFHKNAQTLFDIEL